MKTSESLKNLLPALLKFHENVDIVLKNKSNDVYRSKYATLDEIITICKPTLCESGLLVVQSVTGTSEVTTYLYHAESSEYMCDIINIEPYEKRDKEGNIKPTTPQDIGSNITYMQRYAYKAILNIAFGDIDDDGNSASGLDAKKKQQEIANEKIAELSKQKIEIQKMTTEQFKECLGWLETVIIVEKRFETVEEAMSSKFFYVKKHLPMIERQFNEKFKDKL